ncbi:MAG: nucleotide exchange factor GrpE [Candidatus Staskawiczbacteria bacterium]|nr:nucleotide exchange factor GrpE [Candidatus Staskawiczbacteria bacterium]
MAQENNVKPASAGSSGVAKEEKLNESEELKKKSEEYLNGWKRERADFLNYKKSEMERIGELAKYANEELILKIIPILDNLCLASQHIKDLPAKAGEGVIQIQKQLEDFLSKEGIASIEVVGKPFDANTMESVGTSEAKPAFVKDFGEAKEGIVVEEVQGGYTMHGKIIRVAKVKINK